MNSAKTNNLLCIATLSLVGLILFVLVKNEEPEKSFYSAAGIVDFTQYILLTGSLLSIVFACRGTWLILLKYESWKDFVLIVISLPLVLLSSLLFYTSLVLLAAI